MKFLPISKLYSPLPPPQNSNPPLDPASHGDPHLSSSSMLIYKRRRRDISASQYHHLQTEAIPCPVPRQPDAPSLQAPVGRNHQSLVPNGEPFPTWEDTPDQVRGCLDENGGDFVADKEKLLKGSSIKEVEKNASQRSRFSVLSSSMQDFLARSEGGSSDFNTGRDDDQGNGLGIANELASNSGFQTSSNSRKRKNFQRSKLLVDVPEAGLRAAMRTRKSTDYREQTPIARQEGRNECRIASNTYADMESGREILIGKVNLNRVAHSGTVSLNDKEESCMEAQGNEEHKETIVEQPRYYYRSRTRERVVANAGGISSSVAEIHHKSYEVELVEKPELGAFSQDHLSQTEDAIEKHDITVKERGIFPYKKKPLVHLTKVDGRRSEYITRRSLLAPKRNRCKQHWLVSQHSAPTAATTQALSPVTMTWERRKKKMHREVLSLRAALPHNFADTAVSTRYILRTEHERNKSITKDEWKSTHLSSRRKRKMQRVTELVSHLPGGGFFLTKNRMDFSARKEHGKRFSKVAKCSWLRKPSHRRWRDVNLVVAKPTSLTGRRCKVYWPLDEEWYPGVIHDYDALTQKHHVVYDDGDGEDLVLTEEWVKLYLSRQEMIALNLQLSWMVEGRKRPDYQEMAALAAGIEDAQGEFGHGDLVWAKIKGHPMWPAFVMDEHHAESCGLEASTREGLLPVQFFGSYDYARIGFKQAVSFSRGLLCKFYTKCKRMAFDRGLKEAERYLKKRKLPDSMAQLLDKVVHAGLQDKNEKMAANSDEDEDFMGDERIHKIKKSVESLFMCPIMLGALQVLSLGKIVKDSYHFHDEHNIWTEGYTAVRKFISTKDPPKLVDYKMEVVRNPSSRSMPLFRVTPEDGELVEGPTPSACWRKIFRRVDKVKEKYGITISRQQTKSQYHKSGAFMFGFTYRQIAKLIQALPNAHVCTKFTGWLDKSAVHHLEEIFPAGYRPVEVQWKHPDRCSVCYLDEEYVNNTFLQCDKCRILVHMQCYGESESPDGQLWLCNLCRPGAPLQSPPCCLCPIQGGAMKKTTNGRWVHLSCAMWIPETCIVDMKRMEPIDGLSAIKKDRWMLTCSICKVPYGVCIQCSEVSCSISYHILCGRAAGLVMEVQEEFCHNAIGLAEEHEPVHLLSYCRKHRRPKDERDFAVPLLPESQLITRDCFEYCPPRNPSGSARCEPYDSVARRGRKEPEVRAAASAKRLFVEKRPYIVSGCFRNKPKIDKSSCYFSLQSRNWQASKCSSLSESKSFLSRDNSSDSASVASGEDTPSILSMSERYLQMRATLRRRLTFGKSAIHGWGVFTKEVHHAGDMVVEYAGEIVRPIVADTRERRIYNSLVGAGTYMFRIDDERVVDATHAGSIAHLINHSCEPNCYSRVISVSSEEHIIIFAKRDMDRGEELTYDYRFTSKGEQLDCYCGFPQCRGSVNADDTDEGPSKICVPRNAVAKWFAMTSL